MAKGLGHFEENALCEAGELLALYTAALTSIRFGAEEAILPLRASVRQIAEPLNAVLSRLTIRFAVPLAPSHDEIDAFMTKSEAVTSLKNAILRNLGQEAGDIFMLAVHVAAMVIYRENDAIKRDADANAIKVAARIGVPRAVLDNCVRNVSLKALKTFFVGESRKVFVVHGRDEIGLRLVAKLASEWGLMPVILRDEPNSGRSIIEKFLDYSDVTFAIVLLTPDDVGRLSADLTGTLMPRARQNVIMELGFFIGRLGRENVCVLCSEGIDVPSDYAGVGFVPFDTQGMWRAELARELRATGIHLESIAG
jgi:predicted nucleotide-binding protein